MIKHIGKLLWNQRRKNGWIAAELFLVFIVLWFIVDELSVTAKVFFSPQGFDIEHVYLVDFGYEAREDGDRSAVGESQLILLDRLGTCPNVEAVCAGYASMPFDGSNSFTSFYVKDSTAIQSIKWLRITPGYMNVFRFQSTDNQNNWAEKLSNSKVIVSHDMLVKMKEYGGGLDEGLSHSPKDGTENRIEIGGVTTPFRTTRFSKDGRWLFEELTRDDFIKENTPSIRYAIRVKAETDRGFETFFMQQMENQLSAGPFYLMGLTSYKDKRDAFELVTGEKADAEKKLAISFFLLVNIFLGIIATFWYRTSQRKSEIGLRMAMGASRGKVKRLIVGEGVVLLTFVSVPAIIICLNMQFLELNNQYYMDYTVGRFLFTITCTYLIILAMILTGSWIPAQKASTTQPAEALHNE